MAQVTCKKCGKELETMNGQIGFCPYCATPLAEQPTPEDSKVENLIARMYLFLQDGDFKNAFTYAERILDIDFKCAEAYMGRLMASLSIRKKEDLLLPNIPLAENPDFKHALEFSDGALRQELEGYLDSIRTYNTEKQIAYAFQCVDNAKTIKDYEKAITLLQNLPPQK